MSKDLYQTLGLAPNASDEDVKKAFRRIALLHHPDRNLDDPEAEDRFKEANYAYSILGNRAKRGRYDLFRQFRANAFAFGWGGHQNYERFLEDLFLNTPIADFTSGFPWNGALWGRLGSFLSFSRASASFVSRFLRELRRDYSSPRPQPPREARSFRQRARSRGARQNADIRIAAAVLEFAGDPDHSSHPGAGDMEWVLPISTREAENGAWLQVSFSEDSRWERLRLRVPAKLPNGAVLRVKNKGRRASGAPGRGDLYFRILVC